VVRSIAAAAACTACAALLVVPAPERTIRQLPSGVIEISSEIAVPSNVELRGAGAGTVLKASGRFHGRALIVCSGSNICVRNLAFDGNRAALEVRAGLPPYDKRFAGFTRNNGVLADGGSDIVLAGLRFREIAGFAVLVSRTKNVRIEDVTVEDCGSRNASGRNNGSGGILLEEGTRSFQVSRSTLRRIRGNGIWTHSLYTSPRNARGQVVDNRFEEIGRDAIQVGHAAGIVVERNTGWRIGFPVDAVDREGGGIPVAIDTAGNVDGSVYRSNRFEEVNGKCIDLDGFHDGEVSGNYCANRQPPDQYPTGNYGIVMNNSNPDMQSRNIRVVENEIRGALFGGIFVIGGGHTIARNRLLDLNTAHCNENAGRFGCYYAPGEPDMLRSGIYLGKGAERPAPAAGNRIESNTITGFGMASHCITAAPGIRISANTLRANACRD